LHNFGFSMNTFNDPSIYNPTTHCNLTTQSPLMYANMHPSMHNSHNSIIYPPLTPHSTTHFSSIHNSNTHFPSTYSHSTYPPSTYPPSTYPPSTYPPSTYPPSTYLPSIYNANTHSSVYDSNTQSYFNNL
jgi:hypothetical protein